MTKEEIPLEDQLTILDSLQSRCTNCGLCSEGCATFVATGWEHESPRGRIHLAAQLMHGRIHPDSSSLTTFDRCLGCRGCEPLCPEKVPYNRVRTIVQDIRRTFGKGSCLMSRKEYRRWVKTISRIGNPLWHRFRRGLRLVRGISAQLPHSVSNGPTLIYCCLQDQLHGEALRAIANFMKKLGHPVNIDKKQPCCGALYERLIGGEEGIAYPTIRHRAVQLQQRSHKSFLNWLPANSFIVSRMCLGHIHENGGHASDLYQMINRILKDKDLTLYFPTPREVFYQPYCRRTEMNPDSILPLLRNIEGLTVREFSFPKSCCGGYCGESLLHPVESRQLAQAKIGELPPGSTVIVSGPDCWLALSSLQDSGLNIMDAIEILDQADIRNGTTEKSFEILH